MVRAKVAGLGHGLLENECVKESNDPGLQL